MCNIDKNESTCRYIKYIKKNLRREGWWEGVLTLIMCSLSTIIIIHRFPKLDAVDPALLYRRAQALLR